MTETPFLNILKFSIGDFIAKTLHFCSFIYLARVLGVVHYGVLEFALSSAMYFLYLADAGLEGWATREASKTSDVRALAGRVLPLRFAFSGASFLILVLLIPVFPAYPQLGTLLLLFGLASFLQAANLKWSLLAHQKMTIAAIGLVLMQVVFAVMVFLFVRSPEDLVWVPVWRLAGELVMTVFFGFGFVKVYGGPPAKFRLFDAKKIVRPALIMGASYFLSLMAFNLDSVFLGFLAGPKAVAWYNAAYKPVTVAIAMPITFFVGLFPVLSREYARDADAYERVMVRSLRFTSIFAIPLGVGGTLLAEGLIDLLFGLEYANSVPVLRILMWSAVAAILRGNFKQGLLSANQHTLDLRCAIIAVACNVLLNILLIPRLGIIGAAMATVTSETIWFLLAYYYFVRSVRPVRLIAYVWRPVMAGLAMAVFLVLMDFLPWILRGFASVGVYVGVLFAVGERMRNLADAS